MWPHKTGLGIQLSYGIKGSRAIAVPESSENRMDDLDGGVKLNTAILQGPQLNIVSNQSHNIVAKDPEYKQEITKPKKEKKSLDVLNIMERLEGSVPMGLIKQYETQAEVLNVSQVFDPTYGKLIEFFLIRLTLYANTRQRAVAYVSGSVGEKLNVALVEPGIKDNKKDLEVPRFSKSISLTLEDSIRQVESFKPSVFMNQRIDDHLLVRTETRVYVIHVEYDRVKSETVKLSLVFTIENSSLKGNCLADVSFSKELRRVFFIIDIKGYIFKVTLRNAPLEPLVKEVILKSVKAEDQRIFENSMELSNWRKIIPINRKALLVVSRTKMNLINLDTLKMERIVTSEVWSRIQDVYLPAFQSKYMFMLTSKEIIWLDITGPYPRRLLSWKHFLSDKDPSLKFFVLKSGHKFICSVHSLMTPLVYCCQFGTKEGTPYCLARPSLLYISSDDTVPINSLEFVEIDKFFYKPTTKFKEFFDEEDIASTKNGDDNPNIEDVEMRDAENETENKEKEQEKEKEVSTTEKKSRTKLPKEDIKENDVRFGICDLRQNFEVNFNIVGYGDSKKVAKETEKISIDFQKLRQEVKEKSIRPYKGHFFEKISKSDLVPLLEEITRVYRVVKPKSKKSKTDQDLIEQYAFDLSEKTDRLAEEVNDTKGPSYKSLLQLSKCPEHIDDIEDMDNMIQQMSTYYSSKGIEMMNMINVYFDNSKLVTEGPNTQDIEGLYNHLIENYHKRPEVRQLTRTRSVKELSILMMLSCLKIKMEGMNEKYKQLYDKQYVSSSSSTKVILDDWDTDYDANMTQEQEPTQVDSQRSQAESVPSIIITSQEPSQKKTKRKKDLRTKLLTLNSQKNSQKSSQKSLTAKKTKKTLESSPPNSQVSSSQPQLPSSISSQLFSSLSTQDLSSQTDANQEQDIHESQAKAGQSQASQSDAIQTQETQTQKSQLQDSQSHPPLSSSPNEKKRKHKKHKKSRSHSHSHSHSQSLSQKPKKKKKKLGFA